MIGGASVAGGVGILSEDARLLSSLRQSFAVPAGAQAMTFRILSAALEQSDGLPPDAFEVALLDPVTGESLFGDLGGLDLSDAILNLQADGTVYLAPGVIMRSEEYTSELQSLMRISYVVYCLKKKKKTKENP